MASINIISKFVLHLQIVVRRGSAGRQLVKIKKRLGAMIGVDFSQLVYRAVTWNCGVGRECALFEIEDRLAGRGCIKLQIPHQCGLNDGFRHFTAPYF